MMSQNVLHNFKRIAQIIAGFNILLGLIGFILVIVLNPNSIDFLVNMWFVLSIFYNMLGVLILSRVTRHPVGWLILMVGFFCSLGWLQAFILLFDLSGEFYELGERIHEIAFLPVVTIPIFLVLQFFPDGRLPSKRWWPVTSAALIGMLGQTAYFAFYPWVPGHDGSPIKNPFGFEGQDELFNLIDQVIQIIMLIGVVGSLAMVIVRFWKAEGIQRVQMKWLVSTVFLGLPILLFSLSTPFAYYLLFLLPILMAIAMSIAILRYHLFDIDLIIRRTLQYTLLTGVLALVYFGSSTTLPSFIGQFTGEQSPAMTVISTLAIVVLFNPLRIRLQDFVVRRFYRKKYDADKPQARFSAIASNELDFERLTTALLAVLEETVKPESSLLWIISSTERNS